MILKSRLLTKLAVFPLPTPPTNLNFKKKLTDRQHYKMSNIRSRKHCHQARKMSIDPLTFPRPRPSIPTPPRPQRWRRRPFSPAAALLFPLHRHSRNKSKNVLTREWRDRVRSWETPPRSRGRSLRQPQFVANHRRSNKNLLHLVKKLLLMRELGVCITISIFV